MAIKSKLVVNETYCVTITNGWMQLSDENGGEEYSIDLKDLPELIRAMQMVYDEHTGNSEPNKK